MMFEIKFLCFTAVKTVAASEYKFFSDQTLKKEGLTNSINF